MKIFARVSEPIKPRARGVRAVAILYATILVILIVVQLFNFESYRTLLAELLGQPGGNSTSEILSGPIVTVELFALPFLLNMRVSKLMRIVSMALGWVVPVIALGLSLWLLFFPRQGMYESGIGQFMLISSGIISVLVSLGLGVLAVLASWGMWPLEHRKGLLTKK